MAILLLVNPTAGGGRARGVALAAANVIRELGHDLEVVVTSARGEVEPLARDAAARGAERVLVCGGDGTIHEGVNGLAGTGTALGILAGGRGNDLAATLGVPLDPAAAARHLVESPTRRIDLGVVNGRRFGTTAGIGFDADVATRTNRGAWRRAGRFAYLGGIFASLVAFRAPYLRISAGNMRREGRYMMCAVSNTGRYGGGIFIAPNASAVDGMLDICLVTHASRLRLLRILPAAYRGQHVRAREVEMLRAETVEVVADRELPLIADGEPTGTTPARITVERSALLVVSRQP
ncbi:MAG TPA: diacylglycerol kinase family protein [Gemmatimonadales bacterium]|nr:diacylglycerol kinase family protein [Gemmatimonadales bacterium]